MRPPHLFLLLTLAARVLPIYGQTASSSSDENIEFLQNAPTSTLAAQALEASLKANPDDRIAHVRLMGYYWSQVTFLNRTDIRRQLMEQADWFAIHEPQSVVFDNTNFNLKPADFSTANSADLARYKADWATAVQRYPNDTVILLHALRALQAVDRDVPFFCEKRLRILMPTNPQFAIQLASNYVQVIDIQWHNSGTSTAFPEVMQSGDSAVIGLTGQMLYAGSRLNGGVEGLGAMGAALLKKAHELDAANTRWTEALTSPPSATMSDAIASMINLRQVDLWAGGKVRGIAVPSTAVSVDPEVQAAKIVSPPAAFIQNALGSQLGPGEVWLLAVIGSDGRVEQLQFDSGSAPHFAYAMSIVKSWRYSPTLVDEQPVSVVTRIHLKFTAPAPRPVMGVAGMSGMAGFTAGMAPLEPPLRTASPDTIKLPPEVLRALTYSEPSIPYPTGAKGQGMVVLKALISKTGTVQELAVIAGDPDFRQAALDGVKAWKYRPYSVDGSPREVQSTIAVFFAAQGVGGIGTLFGGGMGTLPAPVVKVAPPKGPQPVSSGVIAGLKISGDPPIYPPAAKAAHVQGAVVLHALLSKQGTIENLQVISGPPMLTGSAMEAVKDWKYRPFLINGEPVEVDTTITVNFTLGGSAAPVAVQSPQK